MQIAVNKKNLYSSQLLYILVTLIIFELLIYTDNVHIQYTVNQLFHESVARVMYLGNHI